jgi:hypothetical protein
LNFSNFSIFLKFRPRGFSGNTYTTRSSPFAVLPFAVLPLFFCRFCRFAVAAYFENFFIMYKFFLICRFAVCRLPFCRFFFAVFAVLPLPLF